MADTKKRLGWGLSALMGSASLLALAGPAFAQDTDEADLQEDETDVVVVRGIRSSLQSAMDTKRDSQGVVDAIVAEDIGKFPDTNLAESLQRITGVSIDRQNGEGSRVTVRGFGPEFNLVLLNGRQMPTSSLGATFASSSRSFDFANLASEGISAVHVYKTSRSSISTGGIGSTINIQTTRPLDAPGMTAVLGAKAVIDESWNDGSSVTPEFSGIYSNTFADNTFGVALSASYQERQSSYNQAGTFNGWRGAYRGDEDNWGSLPRNGSAVNRPEGDDVYATPQSMAYALNNIEQERLNGQLTLQYRPIESVTATLDYTYSEFSVATRRNDMSVWFNHGDTTSEWTDGPVAGPIFYSENFEGGPTDFAMGAGQFATINENNSFGANIEWSVTDRLTLEFDYHNSSAESRADSPYGSDAVIGSASFNVTSQAVDFSRELPVLSVGFLNGPDGGLDASLRVPTGTSFRNSFMHTDIEQMQFRGTYEAGFDFLESVDFGVSYTENDVQSAFSNNQHDTWGGTASAADTPDDLFEFESIPDKFDQLDGHDDPNMVQGFYTFNFARMVEIIDNPAFTNAFGGPHCGGTGNCIKEGWDVDRRTKEESLSAYLQFNSSFELLGRDANLVGGLRYEKTDVTSRALVPIATGTQWVAENEFGVLYGADRDFTELSGEYDYWLPAIDFDVEAMENVILRASYSETLTRPNYEAIQGGQTINQGFRIDGGTGNQGNPGLLPFESRNLDFSAEWYYNDASYIAAGFFHKNVDNFIGTGVVQETPFSLPHPALGQRVADAQAALGPDANLTEIRQWIFANSDPSTFEILGTDTNGNIVGNIFGVDGQDPLVVFDISVPVNEKAASVYGWEFALQHVFGDSGFGFIANYTIVDGDVEFDDTQPASVAQFALVGLSDTANLIGFYDKDGVQVRLAYNWRDRFLSSLNNASGDPNNPMYTEAFGQLDFNASYDVTDQLTVFAEGINVLNETNRLHGRHVNTAHFVTQTGRRWALGARYGF